MGSQRIPIILDPSSALRDSRLRSPLYFSAIPKSLFFSAGPHLLASSTVRSSQSSISSSYLNQEVNQSKSGGFFQVIPLAAVHSSVDCAQNAPTIASAVLFGFSVGKSSRASSSSVISVVELWTIPNQRNLVYIKILFFWNTQLRYHFVDVILFFRYRPYVTRMQ